MPRDYTVWMVDASSIQALLQQALAAAQRGDFPAAETACTRVLDAAPTQADALQLLGLIASERGDLTRAETLFRQSLQTAPRQPHVWNNLGNVLLKTERWLDAGPCYRKALELTSGYLDAWLNLARFEERSGDLVKALKAVDRALGLKPDHPKALAEKGRLLNAADRPDDAVPVLEQATALRLKSVEGLHNLGSALRRTGRGTEAISYFRRALDLQGDRPELHYALANALHDEGQTDEAIAAYQTAIRLKPDYVDAHDTLNKVLWETGHHNVFGQSLVEAMIQVPHSVELPAVLSRLFLRAGETDRARAVLNEAIERVGSDPSLMTGLAKIEAERGHSLDALSLFEKAVAADPAVLAYRYDIARLLIKLGEYAKALDHLNTAKSLAPLDQQTWAYIGLCWRLTGDARHDWLNDAERFVQPYEIAIPEGYSSLAQFNTALEVSLRALHRTRVHPIDQTLRGGTQTKGSLFVQPVPEVQALKQAFEEVIARHIATLPDDPDHPLLSRKAQGVRFSGSWSVLLKSQGFHVNHVHAMGWLSSAYYVSLPDEVKTSSDHDGWLTFGESNLGLGDREHIARSIKPQAGTLVLFPSYLFHGTVPFQSDQERLTVAFDVVPQ